MQIFAKYWIRILTVLGGGLLLYSFHYDVTQAGGFSWDDPPELTEPYWPQIAVVNRLYRIAWTILGVAAVGYFLRGLIRLARPKHNTAVNARPNPP